MELKLWPLLYIEIRWKPSATNHHKPRAQWKNARPDFRRFDWHFVRTEAATVRIGEPKPRMPMRLWLYWKDRQGFIWGRHIDWMWFFPKRWCDR